MEREEIVENCLLKKRGNQHQFLFVDTELINIKIWLEDKNWDIPPWIEEKLQTQHYDHYLMMNIDLPWVSDGLRTFPYRRQELYEKFIELLVYYKKSFSIIDGIGAKRKQNAIDVINSLYF